MALPFLTPTLIAYNGYDSGLGNRIRVVLGCRSLAELEGRHFRYVWPTGTLFGPTLPELWHIKAPTVSRATSRLLARFYPYVDETLDWLDAPKREELVWQVRTGSPIRLPPGAGPWQDEFRSMQPVDEIIGPIRAIFDSELRGRPYVGVNVRAHAVSHQATRDTSPVDWFIRRMSALRSEDSDVRFFVSCDVPEAQDRILAAVPGCVAQSDKGEYNSTAAVRAAIVDLYLLAASGYLIGPHFSSFVHLAEHLAGDRLTLETPVTGAPAQPEYVAHGLVDDPVRPFLRSGARQERP